MQPKLDGVRCLFTKDGAFSRTGKQFMNVQHIEKMLNHFFKTCPWTVLDGELYNHDLRDDFEKIISLVRKQKPTDKDRAEAHKMIQYHVYDYTGKDYESNEGLLYKERLDGIDGIRIIEPNSKSNHIPFRVVLMCDKPATDLIKVFDQMLFLNQ